HPQAARPEILGDHAAGRPDEPPGGATAGRWRGCLLRALCRRLLRRGLGRWWWRGRMTAGDHQLLTNAKLTASPETVLRILQDRLRLDTPFLGEFFNGVAGLDGNHHPVGR